MPKITMTTHETCSIGSCKLGAVPRAVAIIDGPLALDKIKTIEELGADMLEVRVDCFEDGIDGVCEYIASTRRACSLPLIGTIRETARTRNNRSALFAKIIPLVDAVDIEIAAAIAPAIIAMSAGKTVIVSEHDFERTPGSAELEAIARRAAALGGHIVKIAAMAHDREDVVRLLEFTHRCPLPAVAFSMGEYGAISRVMSMLFGSLFSYGYVTKANAPGQLPLNKLVEELRMYYPEVVPQSPNRG
jgi:3-dehydroquinate dehydratase I